MPALVCFLVYVWLSLRGSPQSLVTRVEGRGSREEHALDWLQATCRAGAIVLLVGFFFDGGLFKLATGSVFWILLELGRTDIYRRDAGADRVAEGAEVVEKVAASDTDLLVSSLAPPDIIPSEVSIASRRDARWGVWLRRTAWVLGIAAFSESAILLATPFFGVNTATLAVARHYLVPQSAVPDLNLLATNVNWSSRKLRPLLQHADLKL